MEKEIQVSKSLDRLVPDAERATSHVLYDPIPKILFFRVGLQFALGVGGAGVVDEEVDVGLGQGALDDARGLVEEALELARDQDRLLLLVAEVARRRLLLRRLLLLGRHLVDGRHRRLHVYAHKEKKTIAHHAHTHTHTHRRRDARFIIKKRKNRVTRIPLHETRETIGSLPFWFIHKLLDKLVKKILEKLLHKILEKKLLEKKLLEKKLLEKLLEKLAEK